MSQVWTSNGAQSMVSRVVFGKDPEDTDGTLDSEVDSHPSPDFAVELGVVMN